MKLKDAEQMAISLMRHHGIFDYKFRWMKKIKRFYSAGYCNWRKKEISLSPMFVEWNYPVIVKQTMLHEIAHALRPRHHHNAFWKQTASNLGCVKSKDYSTLRCYGKEVKKAPPVKESA